MIREQPLLPILRVATWNIHGASGRNPGFDLARVVALLRRWNASIVALQEVDSRRKLAGDIFDRLRESLGAHGVAAKSITTVDGDYGQMLISRWPLRATEIHDISYPEREPRRVIKTDVLTPVGAVRVLASHLGLAIRERRGQARKLLALADGGPETTVLLGDFNDWFWPGSVRATLSRQFPAHTRYRTFPSRCPILRLDRVYCRPPRALVRSFVDRDASGISDHLPVIAEIMPQPAGLDDEITLDDEGDIRAAPVGAPK